MASCAFLIALVAVTLNDISHMTVQKRQAEWAESHLRWANPSSYLIVIVVVFVFGLIVSENAENSTSDKKRLTWASIILTIAALIVIYFWRYNLELFS
jgi:hypothetical protein